MKLIAYMRERGLDDEAMAEKIGQCSAKAVEKWKRGERFPRPKNLHRIAKATENRVGPDDFLQPQSAAASQTEAAE